VGDPGHTTDHNHIVDDLTVLRNAQTDWLNVVTQYSADPTGVTDSTTAVQNAITAAVSASTAVYLPAGTYLISSALSVTGSIRLTGDGTASILKSTASGIFDFGNIFIIGLEFDHFAVDCTGGHIFTNFNLHRSYMHHLALTQRSGGFAIATLGASGTGLSAFTFEDTQQYVYCDPTSGVRSVAAWSLFDGSGSGKNLDVINFSRVRSINQINNSKLDSTQFIFDIACTVAGAGGLADRITFMSCDFAQTLGGAIRCRSVQGLEIHQAGTGNIYNQAGSQIGNSMIFIGQYSGAAVSQGPIVSGYTRENSGTQTWGTFSDIEFDGATTQPTVIGPVGTGAATNPAIKINVNSCTSAAIINAPSNVSVGSPTTDTIIIGNGAVSIGGTALAKTPAAAATFTPAAPTGTTSLTRVMMGLGSTCKYTPASTGKVLVMITANPYVLTGAVFLLISALFGTGTAPANAAAETGTAIGANPANTRPASTGTNVPSMFAVSVVLTGLTAGTQYWFDLSLATSNAADQANLENVCMSFAELP
jgi:hypothetical protein